MYAAKSRGNGILVFPVSSVRRGSRWQHKSVGRVTPSAVYQGLKTARETKRQESRKGKICLRNYCVSDGRGRNVSGVDQSLILCTWQRIGRSSKGGQLQRS